MGQWIELLDGFTTTKMVWASVIIAINSLIAAAGGVGGGPVYTSALLAFGADAHAAIPVPQAIIFAGSIVLLGFNAQQRSTINRDLPAIMWDLVFFLENSVMMGTVVGSLINAICPTWFLVYSEVIFFTWEGINGMVRGIRGVRKDQEKFRGKKNIRMDDIIKAEQGASITYQRDVLETQNENLLTGDVIQDQQQVSVQHRGQGRCSHWGYINKPRLFSFLGCLVVQTIFQITRKSFKLCSAGYWAFFAMNFVVGLIAIILNEYFFKKSIAQNPESILLGVDYKKLAHFKQRAKMLIVGFLAGALAAALGLGGGVIQQPLMFRIGVPPYVSRLVSQTMLCFTSFMAMLSYIAQGQVNFNQIWIFCVLAAALFPIGYYSSDPIIKCFKSTHVITLAVAVGLLLSDVFVIYQAVVMTVDIVKSGVLDGIQSLCGT